MRVTIVTPVFPPEPVVSAQTAAALANALFKRGDEVRVITAFPNRPGGRVFPGFRRKLFETSADDGYKVTRCFATVSRRSTILSRLLENLTFGVTAASAVLLSRNPGVVYAVTWPLVATSLVYLAARIRGLRFVLNVQDLYPESLAAQGRVSEAGLLAGMMRRFDQIVARRSDKIVVIAEHFRVILERTRSVPRGRISVVANWIDEDRIIPDVGGEAIRSELGIPLHEFVLAFGGNIGPAAGVENVIEAVELIEPGSRPVFLIAGEGASLAACRSRAAAVGRSRVTFCSPWPVEKTSSVYAAADILVLPTSGDQSRASVPSKAIGYMLAARPIIAQAHEGSEIARVIRDARCGWIVPPGDLLLLAGAIREAMQLEEHQRAHLGKAGREYALEYYSRNTNLQRVLGILDEANAENLNRSERTGA